MPLYLTSRRQTCQLALDLIAWRRKQGIDKKQGGDEFSRGIEDANPYLSVDPAPSGGADDDTKAMGDRLRDKSACLFERYRCRFA